MAIKFHTGIKEIIQSEKPIATAWKLSHEHLELGDKVKKLMEILEDHENLFISYHPYHNHYHLAEVVWGSAYLAKQEKFEDKYFETMVILLMGATFHDADHLGRTNKYPFEAEEKSTKFFKSWWKNNSLFVENIINMSPIYIEQAVTELILFTDFTHGQSKVNLDYINRKESETIGLKLCKLKKILNEADFLMNCLPHYGFHKTGLILKESIRTATDEQKWKLLLGFLQQNGNELFTSDAAKELKLDTLVKKFTNYLAANQEEMRNGLKLQEEIDQKFKPF